MTTAATPRGTPEHGPAWDTTGARGGPDRPRARRGQPLLVVLAILTVLPAVGATVLRIWPPSDDATVLVASFIPYGLLAYAVAVLLLGIALLRARRRRALAAITLLVLGLTGLQLSWIAPDFVADDRPLTTGTFTLFNLNLYDGSADPRAVVEVAAAADIVVLVEVTPDALQGLAAYGWNERFPYAVGDERIGASDTAIYSRFPLAQSALLGDTSFQQWVTTVDVPAVGPIRLIAAHPCNPYCGGDRWAREHDRLERAVTANLGSPLVVAGDFNAVDDHGPMQRLRRDGLESATDLTGAGWLPTWPANRSFPPLLPIDHVLVNSRLTAVSTRTVAVPRTDHRGLLTVLAGTG